MAGGGSRKARARSIPQQPMCRKKRLFPPQAACILALHFGSFKIILAFV
jgi:hypothetical protein